MTNDRDCENCVHKKELGCEKWECSFESKKARMDLFPASIYEYLLDHSFKDIYNTYTEGQLLIPTFDVKQAIEHYYEEKQNDNVG